MKSNVYLILLVLTVNLVSISPMSVQQNEEQSDCVKLDGGDTCHSKDPNPYRFFGTKTPYRIAVKSNDESDIPLEECTPRVFYMLSRHATRYPDEESIIGLKTLLPALKNRITDSYLAGKAKVCKEDLEKIRKFELNMTEKDEKKISATGAVEAEDLDKKIDLKGKENDDLLTYHKTCKNLRKKCEDTSYGVSEIDNFQNGTLMKKVVKSVSERIGVNVTRGDIKLLHTACAFGFALNNSDAWCSVFSKDDLKVLEFNDDIEDYYKDGYGNDVSYKQACLIATHIVNLFKSGENATDTKIVLHFSHASVLKKAYVMFGLYRDEHPLTADAFCSQQNRKWRSSFIAPFNTNIILALYRCADEYKVATFHNEKPVKVNGCDEELCSFSKFSATYEPISKGCDISKICCPCC